MNDKNRNIHNKRYKAQLVLLCLFLLFVTPLVTDLYGATEVRRVEPTIQTVDRHSKGKVFLEKADRLSLVEGHDFQLLTGNVMFRQGDMFMYCDSAHFYDKSNSLQAFGNVKMEQGDTLFVFADELDYNGETELAVLYADNGKKVKLINKDVMLETDIFEYDMAIDLGYYNVGGVLSDSLNVLESLEGEYSPSTKDANFYTDVKLTSITSSDTLKIFSDTLSYNTDTHIAELNSYSEIYNRDGVIFTTSGVYNTDENIADLYERSLIVTERGNTLTADTLFYDRAHGIGEAFGNMVLTDSVRSMAIKGNYGFYDQLKDSSFISGKALLMEYSEGDTLFLHGETIRSFILLEDSLDVDSAHVLVVHPKVRFYRSDLQGLCDSLSFKEKDSILYMHYNPIVWSGARQIFGNEIRVHFNDSTADWALLPDFGFMAEHIDEEFYNQLSGNMMKAYFSDGKLKHMDVEGNVQGVTLPQENDSTYNKINIFESSSLAADFENNTIEMVKMWPAQNGKTVPLYLVKKDMIYLPKFKWYEVLRPKDKYDIFRYPEEMKNLKNEGSAIERRRKAVK